MKQIIAQSSSILKHLRECVIWLVLARVYMNSAPRMFHTHAPGPALRSIRMQGFIFILKVTNRAMPSSFHLKKWSPHVYISAHTSQTSFKYNTFILKLYSTHPLAPSVTLAQDPAPVQTQYGSWTPMQFSYGVYSAQCCMGILWRLLSVPT